MSIVECLAKLVQTGQISKAIADEAEDLYTRSKGEYAKTMGPAQADAAAGMAAAKAIQNGARQLKYDTAKQALAWANFEKVALEHRDGPVAGVMDQLTQSLRGRGTRNVDTVREDIWSRLSAMFGKAMEHYSPGVLGVSKEQIASARNIIREIFGASTGDNTARAAGLAWNDIKEYGIQRAKAAGHKFEVNENWRVPQPWQSEQVRKVTVDEFRRDFKTELENGGLLRLWDRDTGNPAAADKTDFILDRAYRDITATGGGQGTFSREQRTFEFAGGSPGAEAWLRLQQKYGVGDDVFGMLTGHMQKMATEIALSEVIAPNHRAAIAAILPVARAHDAGIKGVRRLSPSRWLENPAMIQKTYDVLTGRANAVEGPVLSGVLGGLRSINQAAQLKMAFISSIPGDSVTTQLAASFNGMDAGRIVSGVLRELGRGGKESRAIASRLNLIANSAMEYSHGFRFFQDQIAGPAQLKWLANTSIKMSGLSAWTDLMKRVFSMEFTGHLADHARFNFAKLQEANKPLAEFLERYQISPTEWDEIRAAPVMDVNGARFMDTTAVANQAIAEKLRTGIIQERRFAILEPDARIRAITTAGLPQGTLMGEVARSLALFKSFSMTMTATHIMRMASQDTTAGMVRLGLPFAVFGIFAGAIAMQTKNLLNGKDFQTMRDPTFWAQAMTQGVGLGIYGDLLNAAFTRSGRSPLADFAGPAAGAVEDAIKLSFGQVRRGAEGKDSTFGGELIRTARRYTPGTWYTKLAVDRLLWDRLQTMVDKDYRTSWHRQEEQARKQGQGFFWASGEAMPGRAPSLGTSLR